MSRLEHFVTVNNERVNVTGRLLRLESVSIAPSPAGFPQMQAQIGAATYIVPPVEPVSGDTQGAARLPVRRRSTPATTNANAGAAQSVVTSTWHQLVHRRLWPVGVLLLVALVAIPVVLARDPEAAEVPAPAPVGGPTSTTRSLRRSWRRPRPRMRPPPPRARRPQGPVQAGAGEDAGADHAAGHRAQYRRIAGHRTHGDDDQAARSRGATGAELAEPLPIPSGPGRRAEKKTYPANSVIVRFGGEERLARAHAASQARTAGRRGRRDAGAHLHGPDEGRQAGQVPC